MRGCLYAGHRNWYAAYLESSYSTILVSKHQETHSFGAKISLLKTIGNKIDTRPKIGKKKENKREREKGMGKKDNNN